MPSLHLKSVNIFAVVNKLKGSAVHIHQLVVCVCVSVCKSVLGS